MCVRPRAHESARGARSPPTASIAAFSLSIIDSARIVFVLHLSGSAPFPRARARSARGSARGCAVARRSAEGPTLGQVHPQRPLDAAIIRITCNR